MTLSATSIVDPFYTFTKLFLRYVEMESRVGHVLLSASY